MRRVIEKAVMVVVTAAVLLAFNGCASFDYVYRNHEKNIELLQQSGGYDTEPADFTYTDGVSAERTAQIQEYFLGKGLDLASFGNNGRTVWENSVELAVWVADCIPHSNPKDHPKVRNAIGLMEYAETHPKGFNCRMHAILLGELLTAAGIRNRFITCMPMDSKDNDCHVVNIVWLPDLKKWAMIDSDMTEYIIGQDGTPLSLQEMREYIVLDMEFSIRALDGTVNPESEYLQAYWAKNLYWFNCHTVEGYSLEDSTVEKNPQDRYVVLMPVSIPLGAQEGVVFTHNAEAFWSGPASSEIR